LPPVKLKSEKGAVHTTRLRRKVFLFLDLSSSGVANEHRW